MFFLWHFSTVLSNSQIRVFTRPSSLSKSRIFWVFWVSVFVRPTENYFHFFSVNTKVFLFPLHLIILFFLILSFCLWKPRDSSKFQSACIMAIKHVECRNYSNSCLTNIFKKGLKVFFNYYFWYKLVLFSSCHVTKHYVGDKKQTKKQLSSVSVQL